MSDSRRRSNTDPGKQLQITQINTQGSKSDVLTTVRQRIASTKEPAMVMLQESGAPPPSWDLKPDPTNDNLLTGVIKGNGRRSDVHMVVQQARGRRNSEPVRNNQIIMSNRPFTAMENDSGRTGPGLRPPLVVETQDAILASVHQPSGAPPFATSQSKRQWEDLSEQANKKHKPMAMIGDFNADSQRLATALSPMGGHVVSPAMPTQQSGNTLDHGVFSVPGATVRQGTLMSGDHTEQVFTMPLKRARSGTK